MGYNYRCDGPCGRQFDDFPPFAGEFTETFLKTDGGVFAEVFDPGEKVTLCKDCMAEVVL